eukprot:jgi/Mesvir1/16431/Mv18154-RA.1
MAEAASTKVLTGRADVLDSLKPVDVRKAALLDSLCKSAWEMAPLEKKPPLPPAICGFLVLDGNHFTTLIKSVKFELVAPNMTVDQRSVWYKAMLNGFMKAEKLRVVARGGKEQEVTKTVAAEKLEEWAMDWTKFGGWTCRCSRKGEQAKAEGDGAGDKAGGAEETDKWGPDQKNFMQRWLFWCEDPLKPVVDGKPAIAEDIAARQDFLDARPKDKAHELSIFTAHRELASFQYFDSLIQAPIMSCEAPPSNLIKIMEVAKNLKEAAVQFAHIKFLEKPELMAACKQLDGTFNPVLVREHVFGVKLKATDLDVEATKFIAECRLTRDFWRVVVTATRAIILTLRDLPPAQRKVVDQKDWKFPRGLLASHPRHLYDDLGVKTKHLLGVPKEAAAEVEKEVEEASEEGKGTTKAKKGWRDRLEAYSDWKGVRMGSDWIAYRTMAWKENEKRKDLVVTKVVDELCTGSDKIPRSLKDQAFAVLDLAADSNEKWRNLRKWDPDCIPEERHIPKPSSHLNPVVWDVVDKMTNALFRGPCRVLLVFGELAHIRRWKRLVRLIKYWLAEDGTVVMTLPPRSTGMEQCPDTILLNEDDDPEPSADTDFVASTPLQKRFLEARNVEGPRTVAGGGPAFAGLMRPTEVVDVEAPPGTSAGYYTELTAGLGDTMRPRRMPFHAPTVHSAGKGEEETPVRFPRGSASGTVSGEAGRVVGQAAVGEPVAQPGAGGDELPPNAPTHAPALPCGQPEKTYEDLMAEAAAAQGQKAKRRGGGRRGAGQETEGADEPSQPQKGGGQGRDGGGLPVAEKGADCTAVDPIRDVEPDVRMRFMDGAKLGRGGWTSKWVEDMWLNWQHKYPNKEDFLLFGTLLGREKEKVVIRWFDEGYELGRSDESERRFRFPLKFASEHVTLLKEGASWDNIPSHRPGKR